MQIPSSWFGLGSLLLLEFSILYIIFRMRRTVTPNDDFVVHIRHFYASLGRRKFISDHFRTQSGDG